MVQLPRADSSELAFIRFEKVVSEEIVDEDLYPIEDVPESSIRPI